MEQEDIETLEKWGGIYATLIGAVAGTLAVLVIAVYQTDWYPSWRVPATYIIHAALVLILVPAILLHRIGRAHTNRTVMVLGLVLLAGGTYFDMAATVYISPTLDMEGNEIARALLDNGYSIPYVYAYGFLAQNLILAILIILWAAFFRHKEIMFELVQRSQPRSFPEFLKAMMGGRLLSWRQFFFSFSLPALRNSFYYSIWLVPVAAVFFSPSRWLLGLEWLNLAPVSRQAGLVIFAVVFVCACSLWLQQEYARHLASRSEK